MEKLKCQSWKINLTHNVSGIVLEIAYSFESQSTVKKKLSDYSSSGNSIHGIKEEEKWSPRAHIRKYFGEKDHEWERKL